MSKQAQKWPDRIWIVRHGESAANVARQAALDAGLAVIEVAQRDMDVPLSETGERQAKALGRWFKQEATAEQPNVVLASSYKRARQTAELIMQESGLNLSDITMVVDERLREKEFGILDRLTTLGIEQTYPEQAKIRAAIGKFYHRPPGGESWCDVILRLRSVLDTISREYAHQRVLIVCHNVVVMCFRYLFEQLNEEQVLEIERQNEVANCSVTAYHYDPNATKYGGLVLERFNFVASLEVAGEPITNLPDAPVAPKG